VPYTYKLHSGKTVIQYIYDSHYQGAAEAARLGDGMGTLKGLVDPGSSTMCARGLSTRPGTPLCGATPSCSTSSSRAAFPMLKAAPDTIPAGLKPKTRA
jgi:hypothetical protein